jgi:molybdopterin-guanine dinucleotide biosynthesis protein A
VVADRIPDVGPLGGLDALAAACATPWLLTIPVDLVGVNECLLPTLIASAGDSGAFAQDDDGVQPLVALWRVEKLLRAVPRALEAGEYAMQSLQERMDMVCVRFTGVRFGNLNTPADLVAAGMATS